MFQETAVTSVFDSRRNPVDGSGQASTTLGPEGVTVRVGCGVLTSTVTEFRAGIPAGERELSNNTVGPVQV